MYKLFTILITRKNAHKKVGEDESDESNENRRVEEAEWNGSETHQSERGYFHICNSKFKQKKGWIVVFSSRDLTVHRIGFCIQILYIVSNYVQQFLSHYVL